MAWLDQNSSREDAAAVLWRLIDRGNFEAGAWADIVARAFAWLDHNPDTTYTISVLASLLRQKRLDLTASADVVRRTFDWLDHKGNTRDGARLLKDLLARSDLDPGDTAKTIRRTFDWLDQHPTNPESGLLLYSVLDRIGLTPKQDAEAKKRATAWLKQYPEAEYAAPIRVVLRTRFERRHGPYTSAAENTGGSKDSSRSSPTAGGPEQLEHSVGSDTENSDDQTDLLFRVYIPLERLYAAEADRLLSLFRDWLITTRRHGVRQAGYSTASGKMYEFFADPSIVRSGLQKEFDSFSNFLTLCVTDTTAAADMLIPLGIERVNSADFVARISREVRQLQTDLTHERERRIMIIQHNIEKELVDGGAELRKVPRAGIQALINSLVPGPSAPDSLALLTEPQSPYTPPPVTFNINPQIVSAVKSTIIQNVQGTVQMGPQASQLLELIEQFGGQQKRELKSAVYEVEDADAPVVDRSSAKHRLNAFLSQIAGSVRDVTLELLEKYIEKKLGL